MEFEEKKLENEKNVSKSPQAYVDEFNGTYYLTPKDPTSFTAFLSIDRQTKVAVFDRYGIRVKQDWECFTIACNYLRTLVIATMDACKKNFGKKSYIQFYDMLITSSSFKKNEKAEKTGSLNVVINTADAVEQIITDPEGFWVAGKVNPKDYFFPEEDNAEENSDVDFKLMKQIEDVTRLVCHKKHGITISDKYLGLTTAVAYTFFEIACRCIIDMVKVSENVSQMERILMGEYADINGMVDEDGRIKITIIPGAISKRRAKDDMTEKDEFGE